MFSVHVSAIALDSFHCFGLSSHIFRMLWSGAQDFMVCPNKAQIAERTEWL